MTHAIDQGSVAADAGSNPGISLTIRMNDIHLDRIGPAFALMSAGLLWPIAASAGDMDAVGAIVIAFYLYCGIVLVASAACLYFCRSIRDRTHRAIARLSILLLVLTPVPMMQLYGKTLFMPAFLAVVASINGSGSSQHNGASILIAYAVAFVLFVPLVTAWMRIGNRYAR
jgi:hypothetical protein